MQVRHDTSLLEQAVGHIVRRASIPLIEAEAVAQEKMHRATAFRRLATGAAIALVAIGVGIGIYFSKRVDHSVAFDQRPAPPVQTRSLEETPPEPKEAEISQSELVPQSLPNPPIITRDFTIFQYDSVFLSGVKWQITAGHSFSTEEDQLARNWSDAWCYTRLMRDGLEINIELGARKTFSSAQSSPESNEAALSNVALTPFEVLTLATRCPWLDKRTFDVETIGGGSLIRNAQFRLKGNVLSFKGKIETSFTTQLKNYSFDSLEISSHGGDLDAGIAAGRWLRSNHKSVRVNEECLSACIFALAGGVFRQADKDAHIGVHRFYKLSRAEEGDLELGQAMSAEVLKYLQSMGIKNELWFAMAKTPSSTIQYIEHDKLRTWGLLGAPLIELPDEPNVDKVESQPTVNVPFDGKTYKLIGFDAPGNDFPEMPLRDLTENECVRQCLLAPSCNAATYNTKSRACFLKSGIAGVQPFISATTYYRLELHGKF